ncbi:MAG: hypothetical protein ACT4OX_06335 [Actinomycetota bacterium]
MTTVGASFPAPRLVTRFVAPDAIVHEVDTADGRVLAWRREASSPAVSLLELDIPRPVAADEELLLPFLEDPSLHGSVLISSSANDADVSRLFPLSIGAAPVPPLLIPEFAMLWILHDGPFGRFAWRNAFVDGQCVLNDALDPDAVGGSGWDVVAEVDYADCARYFLGDIEIRDLIARGHLHGSLAGMSTLSWYVERDETPARAALYRSQVEALLAWIEVARSDAVLQWVTEMRQSGTAGLVQRSRDASV